jgi:hypothetical protein
MKKLTSILVIWLLMGIVFAQEDTTETPPGEEDAGAIGPEDGILYAFDKVADNIAEFLSRIGGEETHANTIRRIVAERRAEHLRLLRLKNEGEITAQEFSKMVSGLNEQIQKKEQALSKAEEKIAAKGNAPSEPGSTSGQKGNSAEKGSTATNTAQKGQSAGKGNQ